jgi:PBSX family phage terminase large subunit
MQENNATTPPALYAAREVSMTSIAYDTIRWFHKDLGKRYMVNQGGTYAGKTMSILYGIYQIIEHIPQPLKIRVVGMTMGHLKTGAIDDFEKTLSSVGADYVRNITDKLFSFPKGVVAGKTVYTTIQFMSLDDPEKAKGGKFDLVFLNEANTIPYETVKEIDSRSERGIIMDYNPTRPFWLHTEGYLAQDDDGNTYIKRRDVSFYQWNYLQNLENLSYSKIQQIESWKKTDPSRYRVYGLGYLGKLEGLVHPKVTLINEDDCPHIEDSDFMDFGLDMGGTDPYALVLACVHGKDIYLREFLYQSDHISDLFIDEVLIEKGILNICHTYDLVIHADTNNVMATKKLRMAGFRVADAKKSAGSVEHGINILNGFENIYITLQSPNFVRASKNYVYKTNLNTGEAKPINKDKHLWDAARYVVLSSRFLNSHKD